jgi:thioesterase domain-containing protein/acyl carrier protein
VNPCPAASGSPRCRVRDLMIAAWSQHVPGLQFDETLRWDECGVDSLAAMQLLGDVGDALGADLSFDLIEEDRSLGDLIDKICAGAFAQPVVGRPKLFLLPGIGGDAPRLARFRQSLRQDLDIHTLVFPGLEFSTKVLVDLGKTAEEIATQLLDREPPASFALAGYSYGAYLAVEVAIKLVERGRPPSLLIAFDPPVWHHDVKAMKRIGLPTLREGVRKALPRSSETMRSYIDRWLFLLVRGLGSSALEKYFVLFDPLQSASQRRMRAVDVARRARVRGLASWTLPTKWSVPTLLVTSDDASPTTTEEWRSRCADLRVTHVGGDHLELFEPERLDRLKTALLEALTSSEAGQGTHFHDSGKPAAASAAAR